MHEYTDSDIHRLEKSLRNMATKREEKERRVERLKEKYEVHSDRVVKHSVYSDIIQLNREIIKIKALETSLTRTLSKHKGV